MAKKKLTETQKKAIEQRNKAYQDLTALSIMWAEEGDEELDLSNMSRRDAKPPEDPAPDKFNPDGIHDIITFAEHPYFCNQTLHPWQKLILVLLYMGSPGNQNLAVDMGQKDKPGCTGCVWEYAKKSEIESANLWDKNKIDKKSYLPVENSRCLGCTRFDQQVRESRFEALKENAKTLAEERKYERLHLLEQVDSYESMHDLLDDSEFNQEIRKQVDKKLGNQFNELIMVLGRRSGKSYLVSLIALYEVYRLLQMKHPQKRYNLLEFDEITVLNVAKNEKQAKVGIFSKIKPLALSSPYFSAHVGKDLELELRFLTENDKEENARRRANGISELDGSIICHCGHSSAAGLVGGTNWVVILDELAAMAGETKDSGVDYKLYEDLSPTIATFGADGKIISLSNPLGPFGLLYDLYSTRTLDPNTLIMQLPTWLSNPSIGLDWLETQKTKSPESYPMQYGAVFGDASQNPYLSPDVIEMAFHHRPTPRVDSAWPMVRYFCHVDPATSSDYYALVVCHAAMPVNDPTALPAIFIDHIHYWEPKGKLQPINSQDVEDYIIKLNQNFKFAQVSFDQWNSQSAIITLQRSGVNAVCKQFTKPYVEMIFGTMHQLFAENRIFIYNINTVYKDPVTSKMIYLQEIDLAKQQLKMLQKKWRATGFKIEALTGYNDDIPDCIAAAAYECLHSKIGSPLPLIRTVWAG